MVSHVFHAQTSTHRAELMSKASGRKTLFQRLWWKGKQWVFVLPSVKETDFKLLFCSGKILLFCVWNNILAVFDDTTDKPRFTFSHVVDMLPPTIPSIQCLLPSKGICSLQNRHSFRCAKRILKCKQCQLGICVVKYFSIFLEKEILEMVASSPHLTKIIILPYLSYHFCKIDWKTESLKFWICNETF